MGENNPVTHALSPSFLRICMPQSHVLWYLCASRPCKNQHPTGLTQQPVPVPHPPPLLSSFPPASGF